jgi:hypothetical protein
MPLIFRVTLGLPGHPTVAARERWTSGALSLEEAAPGLLNSALGPPPVSRNAGPIAERARMDSVLPPTYTGLHRTPQEVVVAAIQEDIDAIGISILPGAHMTVFPRVLALLVERGAGDIL